MCSCLLPDLSVCSFGFVFLKQRTGYEMRISDWSSDVCSSDLIGEMEFLGSFWRSRLSGTALGDEQLVADFSINAVRRLSLDEGAPLTIELPASRLIAFPAQNAPGDGARAG